MRARGQVAQRLETFGIGGVHVVEQDDGAAVRSHDVAHEVHDAFEREEPELRGRQLRRRRPAPDSTPGAPGEARGRTGCRSRPVGWPRSHDRSASAIRLNATGVVIDARALNTASPS